MAVDERQRNVLHTRLEQVLGGEEAATLMSYLPPVGWADVATKRDLDHFADRLRLELHEGLTSVRTEMHREVGGLRGELGALRDRIDDKLDANLRVLLFSMLGAVFTTAGLAFGAAQL